MLQHPHTRDHCWCIGRIPWQFKIWLWKGGFFANSRCPSCSKQSYLCGCSKSLLYSYITPKETVFQKQRFEGHDSDCSQSSWSESPGRLLVRSWSPARKGCRSERPDISQETQDFRGWIFKSVVNSIMEGKTSSFSVRLFPFIAIGEDQFLQLGNIARDILSLQPSGHSRVRRFAHHSLFNGVHANISLQWNISSETARIGCKPSSIWARLKVSCTIRAWALAIRFSLVGMMFPEYKNVDVQKTHEEPVLPV